MVAAVILVLSFSLVRVDSARHQIFRHAKVVPSPQAPENLVPKVILRDQQQTTPNCTSPAAVANNRLECFLWNLQVEIPEQSFRKDFITITMHDMICTNFYFRGLQSHYQPSKKDVPSSYPLLQLSVNQFHATCRGRYHATGGISGNVQAYVLEQQQNLQDLEETRNKALNAVFGMRPDRKASIKTPTACTAESCATCLTCRNIHFSGSISAKLIQAFSKTISKYITDALQTYICPNIIQQQVTSLVTNFLKHPFQEFVRKYLPPGTNSTPTTNNAAPIVSNGTDSDRIKNIFEYDMVRWILTSFNYQLQKHLQQGWIPLPPDAEEDKSQGMLPGILRQLPSGSPTNAHRQLPSDCQDMFRGISGWIKSIFGVRPRIRLPMYFQHIVLPIPIQKSVVTVNISHVAIQGLDQMDSLQILQPPGMPQGKSGHNRSIYTNDGDQGSLQTNLTSSTGFYIVASVVLNISMPNKDPLVEVFRLSLNVTQVEISLATALQVQKWNSTTVLQIVNAIQQFTDSFARHHHGHPDWRALACLIQTIKTVEVSEWITDLIVDTLDVSRDKSFNESLEAGLDATINTALQLVVQEYRDLWSLLVRGVVHDLGATRLNGFLRKWISRHSIDGDQELFVEYHSADNLQIVTSALPPKWVNFTKFELFNKLNRFFDNAKHMEAINHFLRCVGQSVELWSEWGASDGGFDGSVEPILGQEQISLARIGTEHWDSLNKIQLLHPIGEKTLKSFIDYGTDITINETLSKIGPPQVTVVFDLEGPRLLGQINLTAFLSLEASAEIEVHYDLNRLENLTMDHFLSQGMCAILPLADMRLLPNNTYMSFGGKMGVNLTALLNNKIVTISSTDFPQVYTVGNQVLAVSEEWIRSLFNSFIAEWAAHSLEKCPGVVMPTDGNGKKSEENTHHFSSLLWCLVVVIAVLQAGLFLIVYCDDNDEQTAYVETTYDESELDKSRHTLSFFSSFQELIQPLTGTPTKIPTGARRVYTPNSLDRAILGDIYEQLNDEDEQHHVTLEEQLFRVSNDGVPAKSMFSSNVLPRTVLYSVPAFIIATTVLLVTSNVSSGASVDLKLRVEETILPVQSIFRFSLKDTISELYHAGFYPLLILVVCLSGVWPYVKLLCMLYAWMAPCHDQYQRERYLLKLDALGKFSLVDSYVLILFVVVFRFRSELSERLGIDVFVTPMYGFYSFLLAICLSLVLGHATVFLHRKTKQRHSVEINAALGTESILEHAFEIQDRQTLKQLSRTPQILWICSIFFTLVMLVMGFSQPSFTFTIGGLAGVALGDDYDGSTYSVLSLGAAIPESLQDPSWFNVAFLQGTYFFFTVVTPVLCLLLLLFLLVWPLSLKRQRFLLGMVEMTNAWSAVEVFLLSVMAAILQISDFTSFLVGGKCDRLDALAKTILDGQDFDTTCFTVDASVSSNCWYLVAGTISSSLLVSISLQFIHAAVEERSADLPAVNEEMFVSQPNVSRNHGWKVVQNLTGISIVEWFLFSSVEITSPSMDDRVALLEEEGNDHGIEADGSESVEQLTL